MPIDEIISELEAASGPDRKIDAAIALLVGYRRGVEKDPSVGERVIWLSPSGIGARIPYYTAVIDAAYDLAQTIAPDHVGGCSWEKGMGSARILPMETCQAASPVIALCLAALKYKRAMES